MGRDLSKSLMPPIKIPAEPLKIEKKNQIRVFIPITTFQEAPTAQFQPTKFSGQER